MVSLGYLDTYRWVWLPANLIQARRDYMVASIMIEVNRALHMDELSGTKAVLELIGEFQ
jgi:6-phosphogluconate dehydrogenase